MQNSQIRCCQASLLRLPLLMLLFVFLITVPTRIWALGHPYLVKEINATGHALDPTPNPFASLGGSIIFTADDGATGYELWKSDGTADGTVLVKDIIPGYYGGYPSLLTSFNGRVVFRASDPTYGKEIWVTDGTPGGTLLLADIYPGLDGSWPDKLTVVGNNVFFTAKTPAGTQLWKTDGTSAGTVHATEFTPTGFSGIDTLVAGGDSLLVITPLSGTPLTWDLWSVNQSTSHVATFLAKPEYITPCGGKIFFSGNSGAYGYELWVTDGSESGTHMVRDIKAAGSSAPQNLACLGSTLYFGADDGIHGVELWKSDGTSAGTAMVKDINAGLADSGPWNARVMNGRLLFTATNGAASYLWISDGTEAGTVPVKDIKPENSFTGAWDFAIEGNRAFFRGEDSVRGAEPWVTDGTAENTFLLADLRPGTDFSAPRDFAVAGTTLFFSAYDTSGYSKLMGISLEAAPYSLITAPASGTITAQAITITGEAHSDTGAPVALVEVSTDGGISWAPASGTTNWTYAWQPDKDGIFTIFVRATDSAGAGETGSPSIQVTVDRTPPSGWIRINNGAVTTTSTQVTLAVHAIATEPGVACTATEEPYICGPIEIRFSNNGTVWSGWEPAQTSKLLNLTEGDGEKKIFAQMRDRAGNTLDVSDTIILDTSMLLSSTITSPATGFTTKASSIFVSGTATPSPGGTITLVEVSSDGGGSWVPATGTTTWSINVSLPSQGQYTIRSRAWSNAVVETPKPGITVVRDLTPPRGTLSLYFGIWTLDADDGGMCAAYYPRICGVIEMSLDASSWQPATTHPGTGGPLWLRDQAGNTNVLNGSYSNYQGGPIRVAGATSGYYSFLQHAYDEAANGDVIKLSTAVTENLALTRSTALTISGGYSGSFDTIAGSTPVTGNLWLGAGSAILVNIDLTGTLTVEGGNLTASGITVL